MKKYFLPFGVFASGIVFTINLPSMIHERADFVPEEWKVWMSLALFVFMYLGIIIDE